MWSWPLFVNQGYWGHCDWLKLWLSKPWLHQALIWSPNSVGPCFLSSNKSPTLTLFFQRRGIFVDLIFLPWERGSSQNEGVKRFRWQTPPTHTHTHTPYCVQRQRMLLHHWSLLSTACPAAPQFLINTWATKPSIPLTVYYPLLSFASAVKRLGLRGVEVTFQKAASIISLPLWPQGRRALGRAVNCTDVPWMLLRGGPFSPTLGWVSWRGGGGGGIWGARPELMSLRWWSSRNSISQAWIKWEGIEEDVDLVNVGGRRSALIPSKDGSKHYLTPETDTLPDLQ